MKVSSVCVGVITLLGCCLPAGAALTPFASDGKDLVYSGVSNVTWTKNGNLLGDWLNADGVTSVLQTIQSVVPAVTLTYSFAGPQTHTLTAADFSGYWGVDGRATFYGAYAFVTYLNSIKYGGTIQWRLPNAVNGVYPSPNPVLESYTKAGDFGQLYYDELGASQGSGVNTSNPTALADFAGIQSAQYWSTNVLSAYGITQPYGFNMNDGSQYFLNPDLGFYVMPVTSGRVPEPTIAAWLIGGRVILSRRRGVRKLV